MEAFIFGVFCTLVLVWAAQFIKPENPKLWDVRLKEIEDLQKDRKKLLAKLEALPGQQVARRWIWRDEVGVTSATPMVHLCAAADSRSLLSVFVR